MKKTFEELFSEHLKFTETTFPKSTWESSLKGLEREINEVRKARADWLTFGGSHAKTELGFEYVDCMMYLIDSASRLGFTLDQLNNLFRRKLIINQGREWLKNMDDSYSHKP